ncbi:MAG TPA: potassium-transporting ATPase subunit KdpC [Bellilinea sp.]|nr:potassium-transporting ATPase subunit KdpC [Bellilinea sp.]
MFRTIKTSLVIFAFFNVLTGLAYPLAMTGLAQLLFPTQANGSLTPDSDGSMAGSALIGQNFDAPRYFWGRLSAISHNAATSGGTNYSTLNEALVEQAQKRIDALHAADPVNTAPVPVDLVTASASGLDPHISPAAANYQAARVARERGLDEAQVRALIAQYTEQPMLGIFGEARVNVFLLNLALDSVQ